MALKRFQSEMLKFSNLFNGKLLLLGVLLWGIGSQDIKIISRKISKYLKIKQHISKLLMVKEKTHKSLKLFQNE